VVPTYAAAFAAAGLNALVFDYRNLGVSDGDNRQHLDPWAQIRDYQNAISFLERHERWTLPDWRLGHLLFGRARPRACTDRSPGAFDRQSGTGR
jgi:alpha/beta superfamily hydrolase